LVQERFHARIARVFAAHMLHPGAGALADARRSSGIERGQRQQPGDTLFLIGEKRRTNRRRVGVLRQKRSSRLHLIGSCASGALPRRPDPVGHLIASSVSDYWRRPWRGPCNSESGTWLAGDVHAEKTRLSEFPPDKPRENSRTNAEWAADIATF